MTRLPGLGPKRARRLYEELSIDSLDALRAAAEAQQIRSLKGFGPKAEESILAAALAAEAAAADGRERRRRADGARPRAGGRRAAGRGAARPPGLRARRAGRLGAADDRQRQGPRRHRHRHTTRWRWPKRPPSWSWWRRPRHPSEAGVRLRTHTGLKVDLRIVAPDQFGNLMQHFTGSKEHNMALREAAVRKGLHVSEYGVLDDATGETHRCEREEEVYALLGLEYIEPELRENRGELEAAAARHAARRWSRSPTCAATCTATRPPPMAPRRSRRWRWPRATPATSTWRSPTTRRASGSATRSPPSGCASRSRGSASCRAPTRSAGSQLLAGSEVNILPDGPLDYDDEVLAELDWVVASVHSSFAMDSARDDRPHRARDRETRWST